MCHVSYSEFYYCQNLMSKKEKEKSHVNPLKSLNPINKGSYSM